MTGQKWWEADKFMKIINAYFKIQHFLFEKKNNIFHFYLVILGKIKMKINTSQFNQNEFISNFSKINKQLWILPFGITAGNKFELNQDFVSTYNEFIGNVESSNISIVYYDQTEKSNIKTILNLGEIETVFFLYGPSAWKAPSSKFIRNEIKRAKKKNPKLIFVSIFTDLHLKAHEIYLSRIGKVVDLVIGLDRHPRILQSRNLVVAPICSPIGIEKYRFISELSQGNVRHNRVIICGYLHEERKNIIEKMKAAKLDFIHIGGLYGNNRLTDYEYWEQQLSSRIQICLLESNTGEGFHLKGHFTESLLSKCVTVVNSKDIIPEQFDENLDYVLIENMNEIIPKIAELINRTEMYDAIAENGYKRILEFSLGANYWKSVLASL